MGKKIRTTIICFLIVAFCILAFLLFSKNNLEIKTVKSDKELSKIYDRDNSTAKEVATNIITMPFSSF